MQNQHNESYWADSKTKSVVLQAVVEALIVVDTSSMSTQIETKIEIFKKNLKNWLKFINEILDFNRNLETEAVITSKKQ